MLDDGGTWWTNANRAEIPMTAMKTLMAKIFTVIPMTFDLIDATVEGDRGVLLAESRGASDDIAYHGVYSFIVDLDPRRDVIVSVREYADTDHGNRVLTPLLARVAQEQGIGADLAGLVDGAGQ